MENEKFQEIVLQHFQNVTKELKAINQRIESLESKVDKVELRMESEVIDKIGALFDGFSLRGGQIENLQKNLDERLDSIELDTSYLVSRVARLGEGSQVGIFKGP